MSEDIGDAGGLAGNLEDADGPRPDRYLSDEGDGDDLLVGCACGEKPKCFYLDPSDCAKARLARSQPQVVRETATGPARTRDDEGGAWVTWWPCDGERRIYTIHNQEIDALRRAIYDEGDFHVDFLGWGEFLSD